MRTTKFLFSGLVLVACNGTQHRDSSVGEHQAKSTAADPTPQNEPAQRPAHANPTTTPAPAARISACVSERKELDRLLGRRKTPPSLEDVQRLCGDAAEALTAVAKDTTVPNLLRFRAMSLLRRDESKDSVQALAELSKTDQDPSIRRNAVAALGARGDQAEVATTAAEAALGDENAQVRATAADSLKALGRGREALEAALHKETDTLVKQRLERALDR